MVLAEVAGDHLVDVQVGLSQDTARELVLFHSQLDVVEQHVVDHAKDVISDILLVHFE